MTRDHRYPTEVKSDALHRIALANSPQFRDLVREYGRMAVIGAAVILAEKPPSPGPPSQDMPYAAATG